MIPLRCDTPQRRPSIVTPLLLVTCLAVYVVQGRWAPVSRGFVPLEFTHALFHPGMDTLRMCASCAAAFFMHANLVHLVSNMWYLWLFGNAVENRLGAFSFIGTYLLCGGISMIAQALYAPLSTIPIVGASGAIAGVMGLHFVMLPFSRILVWVPPIFFVRVPAFVFLLFWFYVQYASAGNGSEVRVAWWAHIGGFIAGLVMGVSLRVREARESGRRRSRAR
ncbi:MAG: rhomboid family intramembrane serine protease [Chitinivibrionales bacterium]|nr:rhomboid family intramembrane serine protease [Chitinivibrionales bacterium]MBD3396591.1 rhomboid family intramembrane serine protease [Chitinivibrionales bacterium]